MTWTALPEFFEILITRKSDGLARIEREVGSVREDGREPQWPRYIWTEGNYSCDCNRALFFARLAGESDPEVKCGDGAFAIEVIEIATGEILFSELKSAGPGA